MKFVLTGGPGVGKTTVIDILKQQGFVVLKEKARAIIEREQAKNSEVLPWKNLFLFQQKVVEEQLAEETKYIDQNIFCDRGIIDGHAYCQLGKVDTSEEVTKNGRNRYDRVFILEPLPNYQNDSARREDPLWAQKVHQAIEQAYKDFGYNPIKIPFDTPENRVKMILGGIDKLAS